MVRFEKFLGSGSFGNCYPAYYRDVVVAVKEYKKEKYSLNYLKREVCQEAKTINQLDDDTVASPSFVRHRNKERAILPDHKVL